MSLILYVLCNVRNVHVQNNNKSKAKKGPRTLQRRTLPRQSSSIELKEDSKPRASGVNQMGLHFDCDEARGATLLLPAEAYRGRCRRKVPTKQTPGKRSSLTAR